jgi:hypothetical protein
MSTQLAVTPIIRAVLRPPGDPTPQRLTHHTNTYPRTHQGSLRLMHPHGNRFRRSVRNEPPRTLPAYILGLVRIPDKPRCKRE